MDSPPFPYQMKSAAEGNWTGSSSRRGRVQEGHQRMSSRPSWVGLAPPLLPYSRLGLVPTTSALTSRPWALARDSRSQGPYSQAFQPVLDTSRDGSSAASPKIHFILPFIQLKSASCSPSCPLSMGQPLRMPQSPGPPPPAPGRSF